MDTVAIDCLALSEASSVIDGSEQILQREAMMARDFLLTQHLSQIEQYHVEGIGVSWKYLLEVFVGIGLVWRIDPKIARERAERVVGAANYAAKNGLVPTGLWAHMLGWKKA